MPEKDKITKGASSRKMGGGYSSAGSKKKRIVIKKKTSQKKDISEHFGAAKFGNKNESKSKKSGFAPLAPRPKINPKQATSSISDRGIAQNPQASIDQRSSGAGVTAIEANRVNLLMQASPPTAAQARGRTMRTGHRNERFRQERDKLKEERPLEKDINAKSSEMHTKTPVRIEIMEGIQVGDLAKKMNLRPNEVIGALMRMGEMVTINKAIDTETASLLAAEYNCEVKVVSLYDETLIEEEDDKVSERASRSPVVTIMGHVDHGKTMLLDTIRRSNIIDSEAGAITQHIGAYQVNATQDSSDTSKGKITFLDTPGHEAFSAMRARGASITDIVILVVAADDGVKQQTVEAIAHAREAKVPIIVAVNKIDLPDADVENVKKELSEHGMSPEDWGGDTVFCDISAKEQRGISQLLDAILLQAEMLKLTANSKVRAKGHVVEARVDPGKGPVATLLIEKGTLREGDSYVVGVYSGRARALYNDYGKRVKEAIPATPVEIAGIDGVPQAGDPFQVVENERYGREIANKRQHYKHISASNVVSEAKPSLTELGSWIQTHKELNIIIKADVQGSVEAIREGLLRLSTEDIKVRAIHVATGAISESDVNLASASSALIIGFQVRANSRVTELAERDGIEIKYYSVIYDIIQDVKKAMEGMLEPDKVEEVIGKVEVRQIFKISRTGNVAGCKVISGKIIRKNSIRVIRENVVIYTGKIQNLRRVKEEANEVSEGFECGISIESFNDLRENDQIECFQIKEIARKL